MDLDCGHINVYRQIADSEIWKIKPFSKGQAWIDLLLLTNSDSGVITAKNGQIIPIRRGECGWSVVKLADRWGWSRGKADRFFEYLDDEKMIQQKVIANCTITTICNYEKFQGGQQTGSKQSNKQDTNNNKEIYLSAGALAHEEVPATPAVPAAPATPVRTGIPTTPDEVVKIAENAGRKMTVKQAEFYLAKRGRENWQMNDGRPIRSIPCDIIYFLLHWQQNDADRGRSGSPAPRPPTPISAPVSKFQTKKLN